MYNKLFSYIKTFFNNPLKSKCRLYRFPTGHKAALFFHIFVHCYLAFLFDQILLILFLFWWTDIWCIYFYFILFIHFNIDSNYIPGHSLSCAWSSPLQLWSTEVFTGCLLVIQGRLPAFGILLNIPRKNNIGLYLD